MKLTAKQERMVREFIREAEQSVESLDVSSQRRAINTIRQRLRRELGAFGEEIPRDEQVLEVLERCRTQPESTQSQVETVVQQPAEGPKLRLVQAPSAGDAPTVPIVESDRIWAGVCVATADRLEVDVRIVRAAFVVVGLVMPPIAFLAYLGMYLELLFRSDDDRIPEAELGTVFLLTLSTSVQVLALFLVGHLAPRLIIEVSVRFLPELMIRLEAWGWYQGVEWTGFWLTLFLATPMSAVAALPLRHDWDKTVKLFSRLVVAMYAVFISFGIASGFVGVVIEVIEFLTQ